MAGRFLTGVLLLLPFLAPSIDAHAFHHHHALRQRSEQLRADHARSIGATYSKSFDHLTDDKTDAEILEGRAEVTEKENAALRRKYDEKLNTRNRILRALKSSSNVQRRKEYTTQDLDKENQELQDGLDQLNTAFDSLHNILAEDLPSCSGTSGSTSTVSASAKSNLPTSTTEDSDCSTASAVANIITTTRTTIVGNDASQTGTTADASSTASASSTTSTASSSLLDGTVTSATTSDSTTSSSTSTSSTSYSFNPMSTSNVAVYYGQANITSEVSLDTVCEDSSVDIVILAFITEFDSGSGYPTLNLGDSGCWAATDAQTDAGATGLIDCTEKVSPQIRTCQALGKPVMLSIGGSEASVDIPSEADAVEYAAVIWRLFGEGTGNETIRPFGNVTLDGFDIGKFVLIPCTPYTLLFI